MPYIGTRFPHSFFREERIIRHVFSPQNINLNKNILKPNFLNFAFQKRSGKYELSCNRLEIETIDHCLEVGHYIASTKKKDKLYGIACTNVESILNKKRFKIAFTPFRNEHINNYSHCDIYDLGNPPLASVQIGEPEETEVVIQKQIFLKQWQLSILRDVIKHEDIQPPKK